MRTLRSSAAGSPGVGAGKSIALVLVLGYPVALYASARHDMAAPIVVVAAASLIVAGLARGIDGHGTRWGIVTLGVALAVSAAFEPAATALGYAFPIAAYLVMGAFFGRSLTGGREPIVTRIARLEGGLLEPAVLRYTRSLTVIWALLFAALAMAGILLALRPDARAWAAVANGLGPLLVGALLAGEFQVRVRRFPDHRHGTFLDFLRRLAHTDLRALLSG